MNENVINPKNSKNEALERNVSKPTHTSFKLSNASQNFGKQMTHKALKPNKHKSRKKGKKSTGRSMFKKKGVGIKQYVLEKNPYAIGKKRQINEKNCYNYLCAVPSFNLEKQIPKNLSDLEKENLQLNEDLKGLNSMLSEMIGKKGYDNLLQQMKESKKIFIERPVSRQVKILKGEIQNGEKIINIISKEKIRVEKMLNKVVSPVTFSEMMRKINEKKRAIKELKNDNFGLAMENKKVGKMLEKGGLGSQEILKKLLIQFNNVKGKNDEFQTEIDRLEGVRKDLGKKKENLAEKAKSINEKMNAIGLGSWNGNLEKQYLLAKKGLNKEEARKKIMSKNFRVKENEVRAKKLRKEKRVTEIKEAIQKAITQIQSQEKQLNGLVTERKRIKIEKKKVKTDSVYAAMKKNVLMTKLSKEIKFMVEQNKEKVDGEVSRDFEGGSGSRVVKNLVSFRSSSKEKPLINHTSPIYSNKVTEPDSNIENNISHQVIDSKEEHSSKEDNTKEDNNEEHNKEEHNKEEYNKEADEVSLGKGESGKFTIPEPEDEDEKEEDEDEISKLMRNKGSSESHGDKTPTLNASPREENSSFAEKVKGDNVNTFKPKDEPETLNKTDSQEISLPEEKDKEISSNQNENTKTKQASVDELDQLLNKANEVKLTTDKVSSNESITNVKAEKKDEGKQSKEDSILDKEEKNEDDDDFDFMD